MHFMLHPSCLSEDEWASLWHSQWALSLHKYESFALFTAIFSPNTVIQHHIHLFHTFQHSYGSELPWDEFVNPGFLLFLFNLWAIEIRWGRTQGSGLAYCFINRSIRFKRGSTKQLRERNPLLPFTLPRTFTPYSQRSKYVGGGK